MELSITDYARARGVARNTIVQAIGAGRITPTASGAIDVEATDKGWHVEHMSRIGVSGRRTGGRIVRAKVAAGAAEVQLANHRFGQMEATYAARDQVAADAALDIDDIVSIMRAMAVDEAAAFAGDLGIGVGPAADLLRRYVDLTLAEAGDLHAGVSAALAQVP